MRVDANFPSDVQIYEAKQGEFAFLQNGKPFHRIFEMDLTPDNLLTLAYSLCNYLSHPLLKTWDGKSFNIEKLVA